MKGNDALIAWTPANWDIPLCAATRGKIRIGPLIQKGEIDWTDHPVEYACTGGAAYTSWRKLKPEALLAMIFIEFNAIVVRDGIDPQDAHRAFLTIDEYRTHIAPDMDGAMRADGSKASALDMGFL